MPDTKLFHAIGVDPGPIPGVVGLRWSVSGEFLEPAIVQCSADISPAILGAVIESEKADHWPTHVQLEAFVVGNRASRSSSPKAGATTRDVLTDLTVLASSRLAASHVHVLRAADVKPWATDERLNALGLLEATAGMRHARDAARHALFCAVRFGGVPDPLSRKARA